jgi:hypothetical protein
MPRPAGPSRASARRRRPAHTAQPASRISGADAELLHVCIRARCHTSCSGSASRCHRPSPRRRGSSTAALACSNHPECHQAEAGAVASKISTGSEGGGGSAERRCNVIRACFAVAIGLRPAPYNPCNQRWTSAKRARTAAGAVDCGVFFAAAEARGATRLTTSWSNRSLARRHSSSDSDSNWRPSVCNFRTSAPTISCARRNGTPRPTR